MSCTKHSSAMRGLKIRINIVNKRRGQQECNISNGMRLVHAELTMKGHYPLKPHQIEGVQWLLDRERESDIKGGLLCDEPGMGKTIQMVALIRANPVHSTLLIVPVCVVNQWKEALRKIFGPGKVILHIGSSRPRSWKELKQLRVNRGTSGIIMITTYGIVTSSKPSKDNLLFENHWERVVIDEGHFIRNKKTLSFKKVNALKRHHSWVLTGTPLQNKLSDIRTLFKFVANKKTLPPLEKMVSEYFIRRTKDVLRESHTALQNYTIINHHCPFKTEREQKTYMALHRNTMGDFGQVADTIDGGGWMEMLEQILRLRQASIDPNLAITSFRSKYDTNAWKLMKNRSTKIHKFIETIKEVEGYSLVFCHFRKEMELVKCELTKEGIDSEFYHGSMSSTERKSIIDRFPIEEVTNKVLIIQIKAGGVGLNLQQFTNIFIISPDWNPCNEIQAIARAHRIGQTKPVNVHKFTVMCNSKFKEDCFQLFCAEEDQPDLLTIDQIILKKQKLKRDMMSKTLSDDTLQFNETRA